MYHRLSNPALLRLAAASTPHTVGRSCSQRKDGSLCCAQVAALCLYADAINYGDPAATLEYSKVLVPAALLAVSPQAEWSIDEEHMLAISASTYGLGR